MELKKNSVIAHRGMWDNQNIPENSMKAFRKALENSYPIELDVQLTKDQVLVVFHDANLKRMTGIDSLIENKTYEELQKVTLLNTQEKIPTFQEVLELIQEKVFLDIEIKSTKRISLTCEILMKELENYHHYILKSFDPRIVHYLKKHYSTVEVGYLIDKTYDTWWKKRLLPSRLILWYTKADFLSPHKSLINKPLFQKLKKKYPILLWTMKDAQERNNPEYYYICNFLPEKKKETK